MSDRISDKIEDIEAYLKEFEKIIPNDLEDYLNDYLIKVACERYFEKIVEAVVDLTFFVIKKKELKIPEDDTSAFDILAENKIIDINLGSRLKDAKRMKNIISHQYGKISNEIVFNSIKNELRKDAVEFVDLIERFMKKELESSRRKGKNALKMKLKYIFG